MAGRGVEGAKPSSAQGAGEAAAFFEGGADAAGALAPAFASLILEGPSLSAGAGGVGGVRQGVGVGMGADDVAREQRLAWRQRRTRALMAVGQELGGLHDLVASIR